jgi:hypothetical protein
MFKPETIEVLRGTLDDNNPLSIIRANGLIWNNVFDKVDDWYNEIYDKHINTKEVAFYRMPVCSLTNRFTTFPDPTNININMMPIKLYDITGTLPDYCKAYISMICHCKPQTSLLFKEGFTPDHVVYLTIHEELVPVGKSHRRPGLHIERPGCISSTGGHIVKQNQNDEIYQGLSWGLGNWYDDHPIDGIYIASNVADSCKVWPVLIENPDEITDKYGGIEHLRKRLGEGKCLEAGELMWITDRTPHESLPLQAPKYDPDAKFVYRQFFRLVVGKISVWYSKHNTPNPLVQPDAPISDEDKFS